MKKLLAIAAIGLFTASTVLAGAAYAGGGCSGGVAMDGDYSAPVQTVLDSGTTKPKPESGS
jgi:hypothetical protein